MSAIAGTAAGIAATALYLILSAEAPEKVKDAELKTDRGDAEKAQAIELDKQDDLDVDTVKQDLREHLKTYANTPEFGEASADNADSGRVLSKDFVLRMTRITHKYHTILHHMIKKQHEDRRLAAIEEGDELNYGKAYYEESIRKMRFATQLEDIIFDYFGLVEAQFLSANNVHKEEPEFLSAKVKVQEDIRKEVDEEYGLDESEKLTKLTLGEAQRHMEKIHLFNDKVIAAFSEIN